MYLEQDWETFFAKGHLDIFAIIHRPYKITKLKITLLYIYQISNLSHSCLAGLDQIICKPFRPMGQPSSIAGLEGEDKASGNL